MVNDFPIIQGWECPGCQAVFATAGYCHFCGEFLKPMVEQIPEL
jgi:hypothetical protein